MRVLLKGLYTNKWINGFCKTGIYPFYPEVFSDVDFLAAEVTDQIPSELDQTEDRIPGTSSCNVFDLSTDIPNEAKDDSRETNDLNQNPEPGSSSKRDVQMNSYLSITLQECQPFPEIQRKRNTTKKYCKSAVLTSTPYKTALEDRTAPTMWRMCAKHTGGQVKGRQNS